MKIHELKTLPEYFEAVDNGAKPFEVRFNDRDFKVGDHLCLREYSDGEYTGRVLHREISYVLDAPAYCKEGFVVLGLAPIERVAETSEEKRIEVRSCEDCLHYRACLVNSEYVPTPCCAYENKQGYRKQSEGEWIWTESGTEDYEQYWLCSCCNNKSYWKSKFCEECGAKMKGGETDA